MLSSLSPGGIMSPDQWVGLFMQVGIAGAMLYWFASRMEKRMEQLTKAINRMSSLLMVLYTSTSGVSREKAAEELERHLSMPPENADP